MTLFAESIGVLGIDCEGCRRRISGVHASYGDLLRDAAGWTLTYCPSCRPERRGAAAMPSDLLATWPLVEDDLRHTA